MDEHLDMDEDIDEDVPGVRSRSSCIPLSKKLSTFVLMTIPSNRKKKKQTSYTRVHLAISGLSYDATTEKVACRNCMFEPNLEEMLVDKSTNAAVSISFLLILEHLNFSPFCDEGIGCLEDYVSINKLRDMKLSLKKLVERFSSPDKPPSDLQGFGDIEADGVYDKIRSYTSVSHVIVDSLSFESLRKKYDSPNKNFKIAAVRLLSFENWEFSHIVTPLALAYNGFYRFARGSLSDSVRCAYCSETLYQWDEGDVVSDEHRNKCQDCPLVKGLEVDDEPLDGTKLFYHRYLTFFQSKEFQWYCFSLSCEVFGQVFKKLAEVFIKKENLMLTNSQLLHMIWPRKMELPDALSIKEYYKSKRDLDRAWGYEKKLGVNNEVGLREDSGPSNVFGSSFKRGMKSSKVKTNQNMSPEEIEKAVAALREENFRLKESKLCKICIDKDVNTVFLPCGHLVSCQGCAPKIKNCAVCRSLIRGTILAYIPED